MDYSLCLLQIRQQKINSFGYDDIRLKYNYTMYLYCVMSD